MSNYLAIATVTGALQRVLVHAAAVVPGASVSPKRPDGAAGAPGAGINIFLYQVTPNAAYRNADLPTRRSDGQLAQRPQAALVLHYLLSFFGDDDKLEPQRLLGAAIRQLHAEPLLAGPDIVQTVSNPPLDALLATSNLADQVDRVRFTPLNLSLEELSKVWSIFFQTPYLLSVAYQASAVLIETDDAPRQALPVQARNIYVLPFRQPAIEKVVSQAGEDAPIFSGGTLLVKGTQLRGDTTLVLLGGIERAPLSVSDTEITLGVPPDLRPGMHALQVTHKITMGAGAGAPHRGFESNVAAFVLRPRITLPIVNTTQPDPHGGPPLPALRVAVDLTVGKEQRVVLLLNSTSGANPAARSFLSSTRPADLASVTVAIPDVPPGQYFVQVQVDGAESPLDLDPGSPNFGPTVTLP
ncbi:MAG TPA: Pvc16 family protein [Candidatus Binatia bacterium]